MIAALPLLLLRLQFLSTCKSTLKLSKTVRLGVRVREKKQRACVCVPASGHGSGQGTQERQRQGRGRAVEIHTARMVKESQ